MADHRTPPRPRYWNQRYVIDLNVTASEMPTGIRYLPWNHEQPVGGDRRRRVTELRQERAARGEL